MNLHLFTFQTPIKIALKNKKCKLNNDTDLYKINQIYLIFLKAFCNVIICL
jgi:hypothetical protein